MPTNLPFDKSKEKEFLIHHHYVLRKNPAVIGKKMGKSKVSLYRKFKKYGLKQLGHRELENHLAYNLLRNEKWLKAIYCDKCVHQKEIAHIIGCKSSWVTQALENHNIEIRDYTHHPDSHKLLMDYS